MVTKVNILDALKPPMLVQSNKQTTLVKHSIFAHKKYPVWRRGRGNKKSCNFQLVMQTRQFLSKLGKKDVESDNALLCLESVQPRTSTTREHTL
jgi:hypothetical protein